MQIKEKENKDGFFHLPVMADQVINSIKTLEKEMLKGGLIIDATVGGGGHAYMMLKKFPNIFLIGIDQDPEARSAASKKLNDFGNRVQITNGNFCEFVPPRKAIAVLADLGVSSHQLDTNDRGFSFRKPGPLDMRMNPCKKLTAADLIEELSENELANIIYEYGEERLSRRIARKIKNDLKESGQYKDTQSLAYSIAGCFPKKIRYSRIHPATKTFQALRIAVNNELNVLDKFLQESPKWIDKNGLIFIISFHSLEDRKVKQSFKVNTILENMTKKPITASSLEIDQNKRSRSAKLRIAKRI
tara:strand:- start:4194 stop:5099 length:906 start_codon:yes stop_codon:yes gene_type:complete